MVTLCPLTLDYYIIRAHHNIQPTLKSHSAAPESPGRTLSWPNSSKHTLHIQIPQVEGHLLCLANRLTRTQQLNCPLEEQEVTETTFLWAAAVPVCATIKQNYSSTTAKVPKDQGTAIHRISPVKAVIGRLFGQGQLRPGRGHKGTTDLALAAGQQRKDQ